jgi:RNA polymerase sigma-70 factor (ECF subfamily)
MNKNRKADFIEIEKVSEHTADIEEGLIQDEREKTLIRSLALLNDEHRELLVLTRFLHLKYEDVAVLMNTTVANIKVKVHRATAKLREQYFELENI